MLEKYKHADFGRCPRVLCYQQPLLPVGLSDLPFRSPVKLYCPRCEDLYSPKSSRHGSIDGAFFGTSFPHMLFMVYPHMVPVKTATGGPHPTAKQSYGGISADVLHQRALALEQNNSLTHSQMDEVSSETASNPPSEARVGLASNTDSGTSSPLPNKPAVPDVERVVPRIFGFPVHETSRLMAWQEKKQQQQAGRIARFRQKTEGGKTSL